MHWFIRLLLVVLGLFEVLPALQLLDVLPYTQDDLVLVDIKSVAVGTEGRLFFLFIVAVLGFTRLAAATVRGNMNGQLRAVLVMTHVFEAIMFGATFLRSVEPKIPTMKADAISKAYLIMSIVAAMPFVLFFGTMPSATPSVVAVATAKKKQ
jgi:hypothetical protein